MDNLNFIARQLDNVIFNANPATKPEVIVLDPSQSSVGLSAFLKKYNLDRWAISDQSELLEKTSEVHRLIKYYQPAKRLAVLASAITQSVSLSIDNFSLALNGLMNHDVPSASNIKLPRILIVNEDNINPSDLSKFLGMFSQLDHNQRPVTIFVSNDGLDSAFSKLSVCGDHIAIYYVSGSEIKEYEPTPQGCDNTADFASMFLAEADGSCIATQLADLSLSDDERDTFIGCTVDLTKVQSSIRLNKKFDAIPLVENLHTRLSIMHENNDYKEIGDYILAMRAILNIWDVFIAEAGQEKLENSISIADHLKDPLIKAHCFRMSILLFGYSNTTDFYLKEAEKIFGNFGEKENAAMTRNNINVNALYSDKIDIEAAVNLSEHISDTIPYIRRSTTIHSNAGLAMLLSGNVSGSLEYFERSVGACGPLVNKLTSEINFLIGQYFDGQKLQPDIAMNLIDRIKRSSIPKKFDYQTTSLYANLLRIYEHDKEISSHIRHILMNEKLMPYDSYLSNPRALVKYISSCYPSSKRTGINGLPGILGSFIEQHGVLPAAHVFYR